MPASGFTMPFYIRTTILLVGLYIAISMLYIAQSIIVPLVFALLIAILLYPVITFLMRFGLSRLTSIFIALILTVIAIAALGGLLFQQASRFGETWPQLVENITAVFNSFISWVSEYFDINPIKIREWIAHTKSELISSSSSTIGNTLMNFGSGLVIFFLIPVYVFLILYYQSLLINFVQALFGDGNKKQVAEIIGQTKTVIQRYLVGLMIEATIIAVLETSALLLLGIEYAILLGILGALLNAIPYIGGLVAVALPMMIALATKSSAWYAVYILVIYYAIQLIDNNYIVPKIVASKVKINALFSIIVVIAGNALWGIPGMFLSIPLLAIVKLIFDHIESLHHWGLLLGDTMPVSAIISTFRLRKSKTRN